MEQKHSDDLFRDKLSDFSQHPDPKVWERINRSLDERKSRRAIPIWWRLGGAAAILAIALYLIIPGSGTDPLEGPAVSERPAETPEGAETPEAREAANPAGLPGVNDAATDPTGVAGTQSADETGVTGSESTDRTGVAGTQAPEATRKAGSQGAEPTGVAGNQSNDPTGVAGVRRDVRDNTLQTEGRTQDKPGSPSSNAVAATSDPNQSDRKNSVDQPLEKNPAGLAEGQMGEGVAANPQGVQNRTQPDPQPESVEKDQGQSIFDAIEEQEALAEVETPEDARWTVGPSLAPVYFDSFGDGSPISQNFVQNSKSGTTNMSYGVAVSYAVSKKLSLRSGVHRVDYGYNTDQVSFSSNPNAGPSSLIQTISYSEDSKNLIVHSTAGNTAVPVNENAAIDVTAPSAERQGTMEQQFGYLEVPFELQYAIIDRRFGFDVIGGMSSMFLVDNRVSLNSVGGGRTEMGEARNLNSMNFSGNFGLGFYYNLSSSLQLNMQPMFKYQFNTFSETAGAFRPFSVGVYSGLSFMF